MGSWRHSKRKSATGREVCSWGQGFGPGPFCFCLVYLELDLDELNLEARQLELVNRWARSRRYGWELNQVAPGARAQELIGWELGQVASAQELIGWGLVQVAPRASTQIILTNTVIEVDTPQESMLKGKSGMHPHQGVKEHEL